MPINDQQAYNQLTAHPRSFLTKYPLWIQGIATAPSGAKAFEITDAAAYLNAPVQRPGSILRTKSMKATQAFIVAPVGTGFGGHQFQAKWLTMSEWMGAASIYNINVLTLDNTGPGMMITANLTGCAVAISKLGHGSLEIAHVRPTADMAHVIPGGALDGAELHSTLNKSGWTTVYGRNEYAATRQVVIIGVRRAGHWRIYAQKQAYAGIGSAGDIRSVHRIFP